jgi:hypothetical protein
MKLGLPTEPVFFKFLSLWSPVPEIIDPVFAKTSQNARFLLSENERFGLVFVKTGSINSGTGINSKSILPAHVAWRDGTVTLFLLGS